MKNNAFRDCINLFYVEILKIKNLIFDSFCNPMAAVKSIIRYALPVIFIILSFLFKGKGGVRGNFNLNLGIDILGSIVTTILILIVFISLYKAVEKYNPTQFTIADVNYLFPSPISPRTLYIFAMIRNSFISTIRIFISLIIYWVVGLSYFTPKNSRGIYVIIAFFLLTVFLHTITYLIYFLSIRFEIGKIIRFLVKAFILSIIVYLIWNLFENSNNLLNALVSTLNGKVFSNIPVIGWAKDMIISPVTQGVSPNFQTLEFFITTVVVSFFSVYFAQDYYEEASTSTEYRTKVMAAIKNKNGDAEKLLEGRKKKGKKNKRINISIGQEFKGSGAFIWKQALIAKRRKGTVFFSWLNVIAFAAAVGIGYLLRNETVGAFVGMYTGGSFGILIILPSVLSPLKAEMRKQYIFLLPGRPKYKILSVYSILFINSFINCLLGTFPLIIFARKISFIEVFALFTLIITTVYLVLLAVLIFTLIMPTYDDGKNTIFIYILNIIILSPSIVTAVITGIFFTKTVYVILLSFSISSIIIIFLLIILSDWLFSKLELR